VLCHFRCLKRSTFPTPLEPFLPAVRRLPLSRTTSYATEISGTIGPTYYTVSQVMFLWWSDILINERLKYHFPSISYDKPCSCRSCTTGRQTDVSSLPTCSSALPLLFCCVVATLLLLSAGTSCYRTSVEIGSPSSTSKKLRTENSCQWKDIPLFKWNYVKGCMP
jgi:hypothetical protein